MLMISAPDPLTILLKKMAIFGYLKKKGNFFRKNVKFLAFFWHSNGNFPEGQLGTDWNIDHSLQTKMKYSDTWCNHQLTNSCTSNQGNEPWGYFLQYFIFNLILVWPSSSCEDSISLEICTITCNFFCLVFSLLIKLHVVLFWAIRKNNVVQEIKENNFSTFSTEIFKFPYDISKC